MENTSSYDGEQRRGFAEMIVRLVALLTDQLAHKVYFFTSVSDPNLFGTDPDQAFYAEYRSGSRVLMTKNLRKIHC